MCRVKDTRAGFSVQKALAQAKRELGRVGSCPDAEENENMPPGLGILMAEKFVDEFICSEKGDEVFLIKYLPKGGNEQLECFSGER